MVICVACTEKTKNQLDELVSAGDFRDYSDVIAVAIENQLVLQRQLPGRGSLVVPSVQAHPTEHPKPITIASVNSVTPPPPPDIPSLFRKDGVPQKPVLVADGLPLAVQKGTIQLNQWLFGQFNKLLPVKANCRALAHLLVDSPHGVEVETAASQIAMKAEVLSEYLKGLDATWAESREDAVAFAFPSPGEDSYKSRARYGNQFVANVNKSGGLGGMLSDLRLIGKLGSSTRIALTAAGWQFTQLANPVLDETDPNGPRSKFSREERDFLISHIQSTVASEHFAFTTILSAIATGIRTPDALDEHIGQLLNKKQEFRASFVSTQRSGVVSRMADLDLIGRERSGTRVHYEITPQGRKYLEAK